MVPRVKDKTEPEEITFSEELNRFFPEANKKIAGKEEKIDDLPLQNLVDIFSKIDKGEIPKELNFFAGALNHAFENKVRSLSISSEFSGFLQSYICADIMKVNELKINVESRNIYHDNNDTNESIYGFF